MKKPLLLPLAILSGLAMMAQNSPNPNGHLLSKKIANKTYPAKENHLVGGAESVFAGNSSKVLKHGGNPTVQVSAPAGTLIGGTIYDLQSNSAVARRVVNHGDGTLSVVWIVSTDVGPNYSTRGTGYQYFNGSSWLGLSTVVNRIETVRVGWPSIALMGNGKEIILAHNTGTYQYNEELNAAKGSTTFAASVSGASPAMAPAGHGTIWNRMANGGPGDSTLHFIANVFSSDSSVIRNGVKAPFLYSRSLDGGKTWPIANVTLPRYDSTRTRFGGGDDYAIDAQNNAVAILHGGLAEDVTLWKSMDNGTTFTRTLVDSVPFVKNMTGATSTDTMNTNDGSMSVVLDANNKAHVAYALSRTLPGTGGVSFFPGTIGLVYWNEINKTKVNVPISLADIDANGNGVYDLADSTTSSTQCRYGNNSVLNKPCISVDTAGNVYIIFSLPTDGDSTTDGTNQGFRDIYVVATTDNGATWTHVQNLTNTVGVEEAFASMSKLVTKDLHIVFQSDGEPGTALTNTDADGPNDIRYLKVKTADILNNVAGIKEIPSDLFSVGQNYPNPYTGMTNIDVTLQHAADLTLEITNLLGQVVYTNKAKSLYPGVHTFSVDGSTLGAGIYFYTIRSNNASVTKKMMVK